MEESTVPSVFDEIESQRSRVYATTGERFANYLIDLLPRFIIMFVFFVIISIVLASNGMTANEIKKSFSFSVRLLVGMCVELLYYTVIEGATKGRSLGKLVTKTQVVREDLSPISWQDAFVRSLCRLIPFDPLSAFGAHPWHDSVSKTIVISKNKYQYADFTDQIPNPGIEDPNSDVSETNL